MPEAGQTLERKLRISKKKPRRMRERVEEEKGEEKRRKERVARSKLLQVHWNVP